MVERKEKNGRKEGRKKQKKVKSVVKERKEGKEGGKTDFKRPNKEKIQNYLLSFGGKL